MQGANTNSHGGGEQHRVSLYFAVTLHLLFVVIVLFFYVHLCGGDVDQRDVTEPCCIAT